MFNIGPLELMVILIVALLVVGPKRLPEVGRSVGQGIREFRKAQEEVRRSLRMSLDDDSTTTTSRTRRAGAPKPTAPPSGNGATSGDGASEPASPDEAPTGQDIARTIGKGLAELRKAREELQQSFRVDLDNPD